MCPHTAIYKVRDATFTRPQCMCPHTTVCMYILILRYICMTSNTTFKVRDATFTRPQCAYEESKKRLLKGLPFHETRLSRTRHLKDEPSVRDQLLLSLLDELAGAQGLAEGMWNIWKFVSAWYCGSCVLILVYICRQGCCTGTTWGYCVSERPSSFAPAPRAAGTSVWGLKLLLYEALSYYWMRP